MAVEAHHRHLLRSGAEQKLPASHAGWDGGGDALRCDAAPVATAALRASSYYYAAGKPLVQQQGYQNHQAGLAASPAVLTPPTGQVCAAADVASESGVTFGGGGAHREDDVVAPRKRKRGAEQPPQFLGLDGAAGVAAAHLQQQQLVDVDRLVLQHTAKMWAALTEQRRRHARQVVAAMEATAAKRLRAKAEEVERVARLNCALEERVRSLFAEAQAWRDLAQANEAAATALRGELQQALHAQQQARPATAAGGADDAASCCCGENDGEEEEEVATTTGGRCKACGQGAAEVLLLPCRHLCACAPCAAAARACPACGCAKNGSVCVNFS